jgi:[acyl-carrier-protein] S-malonyltransferase
VQQPALVATSLAFLAAVKEKLGLVPDFVVGHSVGEFAALAAAEAMSLEEAIALVRERGLAMAEAARQKPGAMAAILGLDDEVVESLCRKILGVWPANYNCPGQIVVSGEHLAVDECIELAQDMGARRAVKLKVSGAFHSPLVARAAARRSSSATARGRRRRRRSLRRSAAAQSRPTSRAPKTQPDSSRRRATSTSSSTTPA